jgi:signal transduction histidine kinase
VTVVRSKLVKWVLALLVLALCLLYAYETFGRNLQWIGSPLPKAVSGTLDLTDWDFANKGITQLNGEWDVYWSRFHDPESFAQDALPERDGTLVVPGSWNRQKLNGPFQAGTGYVTYRLIIKLPADTPTLALSVPPITSAYKLWVNGELLTQSGITGTSPLNSVPSYASKTVAFHSDTSRTEILIQASNFQHARGGIRQPIEIGTYEQIAEENVLSVGFDTLLFGSLMIMGLYHIGLFAIRTKDRSIFYFGLFCMLIAARTLLIGEIVLIRVFPAFPWGLELKLEYITAYTALGVFVLFIGTLYPEENKLKTLIILCTVCTAYTLFTIFVPVLVFTQLLFTFHIVTSIGIFFVMTVLFRAWLRKREGSSIILVATVVFGIATVNDMLYANEWISTTDRASGVGLLIFIVSQSAVLSMKLSRAFSNEEKMSAALGELNSGLSEKIKERTYDLELANNTLMMKNDELSRLETSRSHLMSNISHDLGTPLTTIQCYLEAIMDGIAETEEKREQYIRLIHSKVIGMERLIDDLFQLSRLEARQVAFQKQIISTNHLIKLLYVRYELDARNAGVGYELKLSGQACETGLFSRVVVDVEKLHQVFSNLVYNAIKFTPEGGIIRVEMVDDGMNEMICRVADTGVGIRPEDLPFIFDRFYTSNKSRNSVTGGKGLGLSISKEIVESHGGIIRVEHSQLNKGTVLSFTVPLLTA